LSIIFFLGTSFVTDSQKNENSKTVNTFRAFFDNLPQGLISKEKLLKIKEVSVISPGLSDAMLAGYKVFSYTLAIAPKTGNAYLENVEGHGITSSTKSRIENLQEGDMVIIVNINYTDPNGRKFVAAGSTYTVE
jgi:L-2-hydroxyglutarate oxidase LhgO